MSCSANNFLVFLLIVISCSEFSRCDDVTVIPYKSVEQCKKSERYDLDSFQCVECDSKNSLLVPSADRSLCTCDPTAYEVALYDFTQQKPICNPTSCKSCTKPEQPRCKIKYINYVKTNITTHKSLRIFYDDSKNCTCDPKTNYQYHGFCIAITLLKNYHHFNTFHPERGIYSELKFITFFCKILRNTTACNHLANLCVSSFYSLAKNSPCSLFYISQASEAAVYSEDDMEYLRPFLFRRRARSTKKELERTIDFSYNLNVKGEDSLQLVSLTHSLDGSNIRMGKFSPHSVNLCNHNMLSSYSEFEFGRNYENDCKFTLDNLMEITTLGKYFYSIYLNYTIDKVQYLQPVPILIRNAFKFNEGQNPSDWQLVRRFQLFDAHQLPSSPTKLPYPFQTDSSKLLRFKMIRYIDSFQMIINIRDGNRISSPLIVLNYKTIYVHRNSSLQSQYDHKFEVRFMIGHDLHFYVELLLPLTMAIGFAFAVLRTFNYKTRQNKEYYDFSALCQFVLYLCSNCSNALFFVAIFVCFYVFFVYTGQSVIKLLVPIQQQNLIDVLIGVAFWLKTSYLVAYFWRVTHSDIFFIDWERPRGYDALSTARSNLDTPSVCSSARSFNGEAVSAWRNFFVANEWLKLSSRRKSSILFQNIALLICLEILSNLFGTLRTNDKTLNLALIILIQLILYTIQISVNFIVIEKIYGNPLQQFVDVCSTANISVFLLLHDAYGFYIHGRSPHGFSDVDMSSIIIQLQREGQNMCSRRGLLTGSDNQNYIILVPTNLKIYYAKLLAPFQKAASISQSHFEKEFAQSKITDNPLEKTTTAYNNINRFFAAFIDHSIKDLDYIIKDKTCVEVLLNCEFESYLSDTKGTFYIDNWLSFGKVLLYGNDVQIFLCSLMLFCSIFILSKSPTLSAFTTCVIDEIFRTVFRRLIKSNVANKTLIDQRFLI